MKVARRRQRTEPVAEDATVLRFTDGLVIDYSTCPRRVLAHNHWHLTGRPDPAGEPNAACRCEGEP